MRLATARFFHDRRDLRLLALLAVAGLVLAAWFLASHVFLAVRDQVVAEAELPVPEGFCPLSWRDSKDLQRRGQLLLLNSRSESDTQGFFVQCRDGVTGRTPADGRQPAQGYYTLTEAHPDVQTLSGFLETMAGNFSREGSLSLEEAEDAVASSDYWVSLGLLSQDDAAVYSGTLGLDDRGAVQASIIGVTLKDGVMIALTIGAPYEDAAQLQRLIEIERKTLRGLAEAN
jgi:hypothetical protein